MMSDIFRVGDMTLYVANKRKGVGELCLQHAFAVVLSATPMNEEGPAVAGGAAERCRQLGSSGSTGEEQADNE